MNNKISNQKVEVPTGISLNDKDYISLLLSNLKCMEKNYVIAISEASNEFLYDTYKNIFLNISDLQRNVYEEMFRKGWYCLEKADANKINEKEQNLSQEYQDLNI